ncbi:MAG: acetyl-CoA hydrolase/transferase C-terminal domain-containing protein [Marinoscillum sp.]|uniref:acetyl-CoA hydrolase/transferase family protein n=1 Tax=Marinoscillum sp. TaxID=2024838 RepID=UPI0032F6225D
MRNLMSAVEAVRNIKSGDHVFIHTAGATPNVLVQAMTERHSELEGVKIYHLHTEGPAPYARPEYANSFHVNSFFLGANCRQATQEGYADYIPCFLSEIPLMIRSGIIKVDVALVQVSPPDAHGYCSLGISVDATKAAVDMAKVVIAQVNPQMPRTHGDGLLHKDMFTACVEVDVPLPELIAHPITPEEKKMGELIAEMIPDRATMQMGIGAIPDAVLSCLGNHKDLGVHTEMFSDGVIPLVENGVITNKYKTKHKDVIVSGFMIGSRKLYDFVDDNPIVRMLDIQYVNDTAVIRRMPNMISVNSAIEVDLTGQVSADSIGTRIYSGVGGQMDFIRGASLSPGGKPIIALPSVTARGESKITSFLKEGAGVVTTRAHVHYIVTEYGVAALYGKNLRERAKALIRIAHPDHRARLEEEAFERFRVL